MIGPDLLQMFHFVKCDWSSPTNGESVLNSNFAKISGTKTLENQIKKGFSITEIRKSWSKKIENFKLVRQK